MGKAGEQEKAKSAHLEGVGESVAGEDSLCDCAAESEHGEAAVCELLLLQHSELGRVRREADRVKACNKSRHDQCD